MTVQYSIDILLASYNGASFITDQIKSILAQDHKNFRLLVHDDGSSDSTVAQINSFNDPRVLLINDGLQFGSSVGNFLHLLKISDADLSFFCDQDDVWLPNKISSMISRYKLIANKHENLPIMLYTDLTVVDESLKVVSKSIFAYQNIDPVPASMLRIIVQNPATGCSSMINSALRNVALSMPVENIIMHDWWLAIIAKRHGRLEFQSESYVMYRQHSSNVVGASKFTFSSIIFYLTSPTRSLNRINAIYKQARSVDVTVSFGMVVFTKFLVVVKRLFDSICAQCR